MTSNKIDSLDFAHIQCALGTVCVPGPIACMCHRTPESLRAVCYVFTGRLLIMLYKASFVAFLASAEAFQAGAPLSMQTRSISSSLQQLSMAAKQTPHGGKLVDLMVGDGDVAGLKQSADVTIEMTDRQSCDVELLCNGGLSPLTGFLNEDAYKAVVEDMKLPDGNILGLPIVMDTNDDSISVGQKILLTYKGTDSMCAHPDSPDRALQCCENAT